ncbi:tetratricopeptide repeat protein [Actinomadura sp. 9N407]|uniref:tetratricopeptide repeat protein n=1 Tax=Actinomadura sp. 9N407 TaxID=3375154 RepID=UPI003791C5FB
MINNSVAEGPSPFVGTRPFDIGDDHLFHGRRTESQEVARLWRDHRLTVLYGGAGAGKTSLIRAGAMPLLRSRGERVLPLGLLWRRNDVPTAAFPDQNLFTLALLSSWYPGESPPQTAGRSILDFLRRHSSNDRFGLPVRTFAAIDQAELLIRDTVAHRHQRRRFLGQLAEAMDAEPNLHLLLAVREEHLEEVRDLAHRLAAGGGAAYPLGALQRDAAVAAVRSPFDGTGRRVDRDTAESLVDELRTIRTPWTPQARRIPSVSPALLQLVCARLWADFSAESVESVEAPTDAASTGETSVAGARAEDAAGEDADGQGFAAEVGRVLAEYCGQALATVAADHRRTPAAIAAWFRTTFAEPVIAEPTTGGGGGGGGGRSESQEAEDMPGAVLRALEDLHLLRADRSSGTCRYELHHPRMTEAIRALADRLGPVRRPAPAERLRVAERALCDGATELARQHAEGVIRACGKDDLRLLAESKRLLGNIAYERDQAETAAECYSEAANLFEVLQDTRAVGLLLAASARILMNDSAAEAVRELRIAANRSPNDPVVQTVLSQALWQAGQSRAALAVLDAVLMRDGDTLEALRTRGEILADLGQAEPALRDLRRIDHMDRPSTRAAWMLAETSCGPPATTGFGGPESAGSGGPESAGSGGPESAGSGGAESAGPAVPNGAPPGVAGWRDADKGLVSGVESGPVLLRIARTRRLCGQAEEAAGLAARAVAARRPPLPPQLHQEAHRLMSPERSEGT